MPTERPQTDTALVAIAHKVISFARDLTPSAKKVAATLLEHRNRRSGRCDPSGATLAGACGLGARTVKRAVEKLAKSKIFLVDRHGGLAHRNSYRINFAEVARRNDEMRADIARARGSHARKELAPETCHHVHFDGAGNGTQTYIRNLPEKTHVDASRQLERDPSAVSSSEATPFLKPSTVEEPARRHDASGQPTGRVTGLRLRSSPTRDTGCANAAEQSAVRRWDRDLREHFGSDVEGYGNAIALIDLPLHDAATAHEMKIRGGGIRHVLTGLSMRALSKREDGGSTIQSWIGGGEDA